MTYEPIEPDATASHDERIGVAYVAGIIAARKAAPNRTRRNPVPTKIPRNGSLTRAGGAMK